MYGSLLAFFHLYLVLYLLGPSLLEMKFRRKLFL